VAVGNAGVVLTSSDGISWTSRASGTDAQLFAVGFGGSRFVAVGSLGWVVTSSDGVTWEKQTTGLESTDLRSVGFGTVSGNGLFVVGGNTGTILTSPAIIFSVPSLGLMSGFILVLLFSLFTIRKKYQIFF